MNPKTPARAGSRALLLSAAMVAVTLLAGCSTIKGWFGGKDKAGEIKSFQDLNDPKYKIAVKLGTTGEQAVKRMIPKATLLQFETQDDAKLEVINGKVDAFVYDLPYNAIFASQNTGAVVHLDKPFTFEPLAWAIRKGDQDTLNWFNNYLRQIKGDGSYDRLYKKWFESNAWLNQLK